MTSEKSCEEELAHSMKMYEELSIVLKEKKNMLDNLLNKNENLIKEINKLNLALDRCEQDYDRILIHNIELMGQIEHLQEQSVKRKRRKTENIGGRRKRKKTHKKRKKKRKKKQKKSRRK